MFNVFTVFLVEVQKLLLANDKVA